MKDQKIKLRRELIEGRRAIPKEERLAVDGELAEIFLSLPEYKNADTVLLYASYGAEIDTYKISKAAAADKKRIAYPRCEKNGIMRFFLCRPENLLPGFRSIPEPPDSAEPQSRKSSPKRGRHSVSPFTERKGETAEI